MFNTLISPAEIIQYTGISKEFPRCSLRTINSVEYNEFVNCLGIAFYNDLKEHKVDYSAAVAYSNSTEYEDGDIVIYEGLIYVNILTCTGVYPKDEEHWELAPKFDNECYETVWCQYLAEYLSWQVIFDRLPFISTQIKAEGLVKIFGSTFQAGSAKDFETISKAVLRSAERAYKNLDYYMKNNNNDGCYNLYKEIAIDCCSECGQETESCTCDDCRKSQSDGFNYVVG